MASLNNLPLEVLTEIVSALNSNLRALWACSLVSKRLHQVTSPRLYKEVDLQRDERGDDEEVEEDSLERQNKLLRSIAENSTLGSMVRRFKNHDPESWDGASFEDVTSGQYPATKMLEKAAKNMKGLSSAFLTANAVTDYILAHLSDYSELRELVIHRLHPQAKIWPIRPTALRTLEWSVPGSWLPGNTVNPWDQVTFLEKVVKMTCPELESLTVSVFSSAGGILPIVLRGRALEYISMDSEFTPKLRHFSFTHNAFPEERTEPRKIRERYFDFVKRYCSTLESLTIPIPAGTWDRDTLEYLSEVCSLVPTIKKISLVPVPASTDPTARDVTPAVFFDILTANLASPKYEIEDFYFTSEIGSFFHQYLGTRFGRWKSLRRLRLRDKYHAMGPFDNRGRFAFDKYKPEILNFVRELPPSLEELILKINSEDLDFEDDDFKPMIDLCPGIFENLPCLHTCDIHAWRKNEHRGVGELFPQKALFFRRLAGLEPGKKEIWTTRMDCLYLQNYIDLLTTFKVLEGGFEGKDAGDQWVEWVRENKAAGNPRGRREDDYTWPFSKDPVARYSMFTRV